MICPHQPSCLIANHPHTSLTLLGWVPAQSTGFVVRGLGCGDIVWAEDSISAGPRAGLGGTELAQGGQGRRVPGRRRPCKGLGLLAGGRDPWAQRSERETGVGEEAAGPRPRALRPECSRGEALLGLGL